MEEKIECWVIVGPHNTVQDGSLTKYEPELAWENWLTWLGGSNPNAREQLEDEGYRVVRATITLTR